MEGGTVLNSIIQQKHLHKSTLVNDFYTPGWVVIRFSRFRAPCHMCGINETVN